MRVRTLIRTYDLNAEFRNSPNARHLMQTAYHFWFPVFEIDPAVNHEMVVI